MNVAKLHERSEHSCVLFYVHIPLILTYLSRTLSILTYFDIPKKNSWLTLWKISKLPKLLLYMLRLMYLIWLFYRITGCSIEWPAILVNADNNLFFRTLIGYSIWPDFLYILYNLNFWLMWIILLWSICKYLHWPGNVFISTQIRYYPH